jgi:surface antigen
MTEREMPDDWAFLFGGQTNDSDPAFAPSAVSEPEFPRESSSGSESQPAPVYRSRRELRAAGGYATAPAQQLQVPALVEPAAPRTHQNPLEATQAMPIADIVAELIAPIAPIVISQEPIPSAGGAEQLDPASLLRFGASDEGVQQGSETFSLDVFAGAGILAASAPAASTPAGSLPSRRARRDAASGRTREKLAARDRPTSTPRTARTASQRKSLRQRISGFGVMVLVGGLFTVLALPAYADNNASALSASTSVRTQKLVVSAAAATTTTTSISRDSYTATSASDLKSLYANALRQQNIAEYLQSGAKAKGDDYPWFAELSRNQGGGLSPLGYYYRECVDFVAWRLNRDAGSTQAPFKWTWSNLTPNGGDGHQWKAAWLAHGWPTGTTPKPGSVAWFGNNHVGYVNGILNNGQVLVEEYNWVPHAYSTRLINPGDAYYLYAPPA